MSLRGTVLRSHGPGEQLKAEEVELTDPEGRVIRAIRVRSPAVA